MFTWNISVSPNCCKTCDQKVFDANTIIETRRMEDRCGTIETSVCRLLPGHSEAIIENEYSYQDCCYDERGWLLRLKNQKQKFIAHLLTLGLWKVNTTKLEPASCSQRQCYFDESLMHSTWISSKVKRYELLFFPS